ncbi:unnamed protein product [Pieris macdunnoughi]|uniref:Uncharacterized protein n=1 Tax=Pieris macdunnoughi TaxID=345717 RepID=A0A821VXA9_9NEOP|nr:unnamed protein product [Pieris macdunnoughi]
MDSEAPDQASLNVLNESSDDNTITNKFKSRAKKRKRESSTEDEVLPDNTLEMEKNLHASAARNNLDDTSVKKILKKVVTNDHVLAFVKMREKEETVEAGENVQPITRAKAKELMKASPKSAPWNLELTPIKHIHVKTRPEVKALIAQELPDDEDDEEYQPTNDEVQSDDDHATCSDIDSLPATPSTPKSQTKTASAVITDGPFKVPQETVSQARRQLDLEEEATIALRTRSKLSLSETPIEHIESSFVPPDDLPHPDVDDLWNDFLKECLNPAANARNEDDDEADPEYNVAADPDAVEEDEESLENSLIKISKKELNDLVTELFNVMPESELTPQLNNSEQMNNIQINGKEPSSIWEGKQEPISDEDRSSKRLQFEKNDPPRLSIGKTEHEENEDIGDIVIAGPITVHMREEHVEEPMEVVEPPPAVRSAIATPDNTLKVVIEDDVITDEQILILQQQLRMHIQMATSNFLLLFVNPAYWTYAPKYKEYLETLQGMVEKQENSVARVCNLSPALELVKSWEDCVSKDTPENKKMVQFIQSEADKCRRRSMGKNYYTGDFPEEFKKVTANSSVFLYPYLLPATPYRGVEIKRRTCYLPSEDKLIILGIDQFWSYVEANPDLYPPPPIKNMRHRWGIGITLDLVCKYMFPWISPKTLAGHVSAVRKNKQTDHIITKYFKTREVPKTKHVLIPFNAELTLYEQPESEIPTIWVRYLAKSSKRFRKHLQKKRPTHFQPPKGIEISQSDIIEEPKPPLPIQFTQEIVSNRINLHPVKPANPDRVDIVIDQTTNEIDPENELEPIEDPEVIMDTVHCSCCELLRKISKYKQKRITEYVKKFVVKMQCPCRSIRYPKITNRLKILLSYYKNCSKNVFTDLKSRIEAAKKPGVCKLGIAKEAEERLTEAKDREFVRTFLMRLSLRQNKIRNTQAKRALFTILSRFNSEGDDPIKLMDDIYKACDVELADTYNEFLGFLNPEQADEIDKFREYFISNAMDDLIQKTEEIVTDKSKKINILKYLSTLSRNSPLSCVMCTNLMDNMRQYPQLARYCFSLFPHRRKVRIVTSDELRSNSKQTSPQTQIAPNESLSSNDNGILRSNNNSQITVLNKDKINAQVVALQAVDPQESIASDQTQDELSSEIQNKEINSQENDGNDEEVEAGNENSESENENESGTENQDQEMNESDDSDGGETEQGALMICEDNIGVNCLSSDKSNDDADDVEEKPLVDIKEEKSDDKICDIIEEEFIPIDENKLKTEVDPLSDYDQERTIDVEWGREEDKLILEVLIQLNPEERIENSIDEIVEILEKKNIPQIIAKKLTKKSLFDIRARILYLLQVLLK